MMSPDLLPPVAQTRRITQSLAMLDAILSPEWQNRYYSFNSAWGPGEEMASMRDGSGDEWYMLLTSTGAAVKGFAHELADDPLLPQNIQKQLPKVFSSFLCEPAFSMQQTTFCYWRTERESSWHKVDSTLTNDGSEELLALLVSGPLGYKEWAEDYFEVPVAIDAVSALFSHEPLSSPVILLLNPEANLDLTYEQADEIGFPRGAA